RHGRDDAERTANEALANLLTPVAKAFGTDVGVEVASLGVQVHGGMGYIEETGAAQHYRDARITPIYEGTNGIQAIDLVTRKLPLAGGEVVRGQIAGLRRTAERIAASNDPAFGRTAERLAEAIDALDEATGWLLASLDDNRDGALAGTTPYLRLFGLATGGAAMADGALKASQRAGGRASGAEAARVMLARYFAENHLPQAKGLAVVVCS